MGGAGPCTGPQDDIGDTGKHHSLGEVAEALDTETEGWRLSWLKMKKCVHKGRGTKKPTEDSLGSSPLFHQLPCQGASAAAPTHTPPPLLAHPSLQPEESKMCVLGLINKTQLAPQPASLQGNL